MGKIAYNWNKVNRGDIISFRYRTKEGRILRRTILVLEPKLRNKAKNPTSNYLLHGIQLEISNQPVISDIKTILESAGEVGVVDADKKIFNVELDLSTKNVYNKVKNLINKNGMFRTYNYDKARKSQVFLEDLRLPEDFVKELIGEN
tara:strand:- start:34 stop:474 length:441 start_codon:yes stop_codon:yes gene_type:complete